MAKLNRVSAKAWFYGIILSLISSTASLVNLRAQSRRFALNSEVARRDTEKIDVAADEAERRSKGRALLAYVYRDVLADDRQRQTIMSQLVTDVFDIWIPANNLGYTHLNDGVVGLCGWVAEWAWLITVLSPPIWHSRRAGASMALPLLSASLLRPNTGIQVYRDDMRRERGCFEEDGYGGCRRDAYVRSRLF